MPVGFQLLCDGPHCIVYISNEALEFLKKQRANDQKNVNKIKAILDRLANLGREHVNNTEQFRREGKFSSGGKKSKDYAVYAVKAHQIRLYGGFVSVGGQTLFLGIEATRKKKDKADQAQLKRVAEALGVHHG